MVIAAEYWTNKQLDMSETLSHPLAAGTQRAMCGNGPSSLITRAEHTNLNGNGVFSSADGARAGKPYTDGNGHYNATKDGVWAYDTVSPFPSGNGTIYEYNDFSLVGLVCGGPWHAGTRAGANTVCLQFCVWELREYIGMRCACNGL